MGLDLTLVPIRSHKGMGGSAWWLGYDRLALDRDGLGHMIGGTDDDESTPVRTKFLPKNVKFDWYGDNGCKQTKNDSYGTPLEYALAGDLAESMGSYIMANMDDDERKFSPWNHAVIAFIDALPKDTPVVLYWH
jgi:hypothetical protein